jgi:Antibiotic biosynthesis monooxygenase
LSKKRLGDDSFRRLGSLIPHRKRGLWRLLTALLAGVLLAYVRRILNRGEAMSVVWIARWKGVDPEQQARGHDEAAARIAQMSKDMGATHHNVFHCHDTGEGFVIDAWDSREGLERFLSSPDFQSAISDAGFSQPDETLILDELPGDPQYRW